MDKEEIVIVDEPAKLPTQCELRHAISMLNTISIFADNAQVNNLRKSTRNIFLNHKQEFVGCKEARSYHKLFS